MSNTDPNLAPVDMAALDTYLKEQLAEIQKSPENEVLSQAMKPLTLQPDTDPPPEKASEDSVPLVGDLPRQSPLNYADPEPLEIYLAKLKYLIENGVIKRAWRVLANSGSGIPTPEELPPDVTEHVVDSTKRRALEDRDLHWGALALLNRRLYRGTSPPDTIRWASVVITWALFGELQNSAKSWAVHDAYDK